MSLVSGLMMATDYALYEGILFIRRHGNLRIEMGMDASIRVHRVRQSQKDFEVLVNEDHTIDTKNCLPMAYQPNLAHNTSKYIYLIYLAERNSKKHS